VGWICAAAGAWEQPAASRTTAQAENVELFEKQIRPLLVQNCLACHGEKKKGGLGLDSPEAMLKGGDSGTAVSPGNPDGSLLIQAVRYDDEIKMPPDGKLSPEAIAVLTTWVKTGAAWPAASGATQIAAAVDTWKSHWAFQPILKPSLPKIGPSRWARSSIDCFVLAKLEQQGLAPSEAADRRTLIRRASFDVTGLPPTAEEVEQFVVDPDPNAFERVVDRLLASPNYGERWARHWLDVARYADTKGYLFTQDRSYPNAYRYRDWVVRALNEDLPYDQFLIQQIAADRLPSAADKNSLAAMGFLTVGRRFLGNPHDIIDDRLDVLMRGTMALTVTCARCHDHKFDPIPTKDYYSLYGVLASSVEPAEPADLMTLADAPAPIVPHVFVRGNAGNPGEAVARQFLSVIAGENRQPFGPGSGRLDLARAIASPDNPLTARVIVNRIWLHYFENGLVRTPSDFGLRSEPPSHPELLDYLASSLVEQNWSLKDLHRTILNSATYQQASNDRPPCRQADPENQWLWRMNRKRLDFEELRDSLLAVSGQLDRSLGGPAIELTKTPWTTRRTIYGLIDRQNLPNMFRTFDFASPDTHSPGRFTTTVPQQALYLMNSPFVRDQVRGLAARGQQAGAEPRGRIEQLYRLVLCRLPSEKEMQLGLAFAADEGARPADDVNAPPGTGGGEPSFTAWERYVQVVLLSNEFVYVD
jgi:cytochrome c553